MSWTYKVIKTKQGYTIGEVYTINKRTSYTLPIDLYTENVKELKNTLGMMLSAFNKPVLLEDENTETLTEL